MRSGMGVFLKGGGLKHAILMQKPDKCEEQRGMAEEQQKQSGGSERVYTGVTGQVEGRRRDQKFLRLCHRGKGESCKRREADQMVGKAPFIFTIPSQGRTKHGALWRVEAGEEGCRVSAGKEEMLGLERGVEEPSLAWGLQLTIRHYLPGGCREERMGEMEALELVGGCPARAGTSSCCGEVALAWWDAAPHAEDSLHRGSGEVCQGNMSLLFSREVQHRFSVFLSVQDIIRQLAKGNIFSWTDVTTN